MTMNNVVTLHQPVCLYSAAGGKVNHQNRPHPLNGGPLGAWKVNRQFGRIH
jgi:hypothetical protein